MIDYEGDTSEVLERELQAWEVFVESVAAGRRDWGPDGDDCRFLGLLGLIYDSFVDPSYTGSSNCLADRRRSPDFARVTWNDDPVPQSLNLYVQLA